MNAMSRPEHAFPSWDLPTLADVALCMQAVSALDVEAWEQELAG